MGKNTFLLNNNVSIPYIGYGTWRISDTEAESEVSEALKAGYRLIDTASFYGNEHGIGVAICKSKVSREDIFVTSKVWNADRGYEKTREAFKQTLENMGQEYLDLYLIHWPANRKQYGDEAKSINSDTWRALEDIYEEGKVRAIGLSNFQPHHIDELMETAKIKPMINQIEFHPGALQTETVQYCNRNDILVEGWKTLGRKRVWKDHVLIDISSKYRKTPAQCCIRWAIQHGVLPLVKSANIKRINENFEISDFEIDTKDMETIDLLCDLGGVGASPDEIDF